MADECKSGAIPYTPLTMSEEKNSRSSWRCLSVRYYVALATMAAAFMIEGSNKSFALVMTHITSTGLNRTQDFVFDNCTVFNTSRDLRIDMAEDTLFLLHSGYNAAMVAFRPFCPVLLTRFPLSRLQGLCLFLTSTITVCVPFLIRTSTSLFFVLRLLQGAIDGTVFPISMSLLSAWATDEDRARLFGICSAGMYAAPGVAALLAADVMCYVRWDAILFILGGAGILIAAVIAKTVYDTPETHPSLSTAEATLHRKCRASVGLDDSFAKHTKVPWRHVLTSLPVWASFAGYFSRCVVYFTFVSGLAQYFHDSFNMNIADTSLLTMLPHLCLAVTTMLGGALADALLKLQQLNTTLIRKIIFTIGHLGEGMCLLSLGFVHDWQLAAALVTVGVSIGGIGESGYLPIVAEVAPQYAAATSTMVTLGAIGGAIGTLTVSGLSGIYTGIALWQKVFLITGILCLATVIFFDLVASAEVQPWARNTTLASEVVTAPKTERDTLLPMSVGDSTCSTASDSLKTLDFYDEIR